MKGFIHLRDADNHKRSITINVAHIVAIESNSYCGAVVRTVDGNRYNVCESTFDVNSKIKISMQSSRCLDNNTGGYEHHESEEVTCGNCEHCVDIDKVHNLCSVHQCYVTYADSCECGTRKDKNIK